MVLVVLANNYAKFKISICHRLFPFYLCYNSVVVQDCNDIVEYDAETYLFVAPPQAEDVLSNLSLRTLKMLKSMGKYVGIFAFPNGAIVGYSQFMPYVDCLVFCAKYKDMDVYTGENPTLRARGDSPYIQGFRDYYSSPFKQEDLKKLKFMWNIGVGVYPHSVDFTDRKVAKSILSDKIDYSFQGSYSDDAKVDLHCVVALETSFSRQKLRDFVLEKSRKWNWTVYSDKQEISAFYAALRNSRICLSPWGASEICYRDFEAVLNGALLFKPEMSYMETYPDIYLPYETFIPYSHDLSDLEDKINYYLSHKEERYEIIRRAYAQYVSQLEGFESHFSPLLEEWGLRYKGRISGYNL
jgi:hypothetical protein